MPRFPPHSALRRCAHGLAVAACLLVFAGAAPASSSVYKWVDADGVTHLSSQKPPTGVKYERMALMAPSGNARPAGGRPSSTASTATRVSAASPAQTAQRNEMLSSLKTRECVVALESMDRLARSGQPVEPREFQRLQQTADQNCSKDATERRQQEEMAAKLRVAKGDDCVEARNELADLLEPGRRPTREQLRSQQEFIEAHCKAPVR